MPGAATASRWPPECIGGEPGTTFAYGSDELSGGIFFNPGTSTPIVIFDSDKEDADVLPSTPRKQPRRARGMDFALGTHKLPMGRERGSRASRVKERSPSPEGSDSSSSSNVPFYSCESSFSPSSTSPLRISLRGSVTAFHTPSCDISSQLLSPITPSLTRSTKSHILTPDSTHLTPTSRQLNDVLLRPALRQLPNVKLSVVEPTGLLTPEPTPNREKLQCQGLTGEKIQCKRWKLDAEGTVYFCKSHQAQSGSPLHERVARSKEEELARSNKPGQCHGLNRRRVQCRSPAITGSKGSNGFCFHHQDQQQADRPGPVDLKSRAEGMQITEQIDGGLQL
ncbi:hypothetical protein BDV93DRAFT_225020 [Ceratobasidium sp. AG-I]|nr:hypothetical protein BDV93DRAFT_225020 [Ceratobasidium sp. AG-I]